MEYTVDYFIAKFEAIPAQNWITGSYSSPDAKGAAHCAAGHCGASVNNTVTNELDALVHLFSVNEVGSIIGINDGHNSKYVQPNPKDRILAALREIKLIQDGVLG